MSTSWHTHNEPNVHACVNDLFTHEQFIDVYCYSELYYLVIIFSRMFMLVVVPYSQNKGYQGLYPELCHVGITIC